MDTENQNIGRLAGQVIRMRRIELGLSQETVAHAVGISRPQLARAEAGMLPGLQVLVKYAAALQCAFIVNDSGVRIQ